MSDPRGRTLPEAVNTYLIMMGIYCLDLFFLKSDLSVLGDNFYARFVSLVVLFLIMFFNKTPTSVLGFSKKKESIASGAVWGAVFSVIPILVVMLAESVYYAVTDTSAILLRFAPPSLNYVRSVENMTPFAAVTIYIFSTLFSSAFKEIFFRGYTLSKLKGVFDFKSANFVQALMYMSFTAPYLLRNLVNHVYDDTTTELGIFIIMFYLIHETMAGIKWGMMTRATGATYAATVDHFFYVFLANSVYITDRYVTWSFMTHMLAIQLVSTVGVYVFYKVKMKKRDEENNEKTQKEEKPTESKVKSQLEEKISQVEEMSPEQYKKLADESRHSHRHHEHSERRNEETDSGAFGDEDIDEFLENFGKKEPAKERHREIPVPNESDDDDFDVDKFLSDFQQPARSADMYRPHHHHRHHSEH